MAGGDVYFVSDVHIGAPTDPKGLSERRFVDFLEHLPEDAAELYMLGDVFDFWVEYRHVVPRGAVRTLGALAYLADRGVKLHFVCGNHDYWVTDYFEKELGAEIIREPYIVREIQGRKVCLGHGDGLGRRSLKERFIFKLFRSKVCIALLKALPSSWIFSFAHAWSSFSRKRHHEYVFKEGEDPLYRFAQEFGSKNPVDLFVFGHLHARVATTLPCGARLYVLGDWAVEASSLNLLGM